MSGKDLRARYFDAAQDILATDGYGALKLATVCQRLGVTTGAFYHAFDSWQDFTDALLETWRRERTTLLVDLARSKPDPAEQLASLLGAATGLQHRAEASIRAWAKADPRVDAVQQRVDDERYGVVLEVMRSLVGPKDAPRYAHWGINILVGYEQCPHGQTPADLEWQLQQVLQIVTAGAHGVRRAAR